MALIDRLRRVGGIIKQRAASAVGALRTAAKGVTVSGTKLRRGVRFGARAARLTSPVGIGLTAVSFAPEIAKGVRAAGRFLSRAVPRGAAFFATRRIIGGAAGGTAAAGVVGILQSRKSGQPAPVQSFPIPRVPGRVTRTRRKRKFTQAEAERGFKADRERGIPASGRRRKPRKARARKRRRDLRGKKGITHRKPRHRGHKRVSFTTASGKKVSFLAAKTKAGRHR